MFNSVRETREWASGLLRMNLEMKESDYFSIYDNLNNEVAKDIIDQYLKFRGDDGRAKDIQINHNANSHIVSISGSIHYLENDKTEYKYNPNHISHKFY